MGVEEGRVAFRHGVAEALAGFESHVEKQRRRGQALDRAGARLAVGGLECAGDDPHFSARNAERRNFFRLDVPVGGGLHLFGGRQVDPELEAM